MTAQILDLDDLEIKSEISIRHKGKDHYMRTLDVEGFISQQKRARTAKAAEAEAADAAEGQEADLGNVVEIMRDQIVEMFPTLPVNELEVPKLFKIFAWLNELTAQMNAASAPAEATDDASAEGNAPEVPAAT